MTAVTSVCFAMLATAGALCLVRLVRGRSLADRVVAVDMLLVVVVTSVAVGAARTGDATFLDVMVVAALLGFIGTITVARFIERRGAG